MFTGQRIARQGQTIVVHQDLAVEDLHEVALPKGCKDKDALSGELHTEYRSVLGALNWLQSRTQFHVSFGFSRAASYASAPTVANAKYLNKIVRQVKGHQ